MNTEIVEIVRTAIGHTSGKGSDLTVDETTPLIEQGILNSLGMLAIIASIEDRLNVKLPPNEVTKENFESIATICSVVAKYGARNGTGTAQPCATTAPATCASGTKGACA